MLPRAHHDGSLVRPDDPRLGDDVELALWADRDVTAISLRAAPEGEEETWPLTPGGAGLWRRWSVRLRLEWPELRYRFRLRHEPADGPPELWWLTGRAMQRFTPVDASDFLLRAVEGGPSWLPGLLFYEIFPDRFATGEVDRRPQQGEPRGKIGGAVRRDWHESPLPWAEGKNLDFYGGDLDGIRGKLDYLQGLGVGGLYLTPIFASLTNHRYDTVDHGAIDATLGGDEALARLAAELHRRGMRYLLDAVVNHVGSGHRWFNREGLYGQPAAYQDRAASTASYFRFDRWPSQYRSWKGVDLLPKLDFRSGELRDTLYRSPGAVLRHWLRPPYLADGYRFDAANMVGRDREVQLHGEVWPELCRSLREERGDVYLLGEHYFDPTPIVGTGRLDGTMNYLGFTFPVRRWLAGEDPSGQCSPITAGEACEQMQEVMAAIGWQTARRMMLHVNTHDVPRLQSVAGEAAFRAATVLQLALPGVPCLYYGDEVGLLGGQDPDNRRPMPWDSPAWNEATLGWMRALLQARHASVAVRDGSLWLWAVGADRLLVARQAGEDLTLVVADRAAAAASVLDLSHVPAARDLDLADVHSGEPCRVSADGRLQLGASAAGGRWLVGRRQRFGSSA